jgi:site-specific DNA recombinase
MRAAMYPRVSTDTQRGNYSIPSQIKAMMDYAVMRGYTLVGDHFVNPDDGRDAESGIPAFVDDFTSTELSRPGFDACLLFLDKYGFDVLIVHAIDRLARDPFHRQVLEREITARGARVEYILGNYDESPEGEVRKDLDATFAKWENAKRVERANRGKKRKAEMGKFVGGKTSYGYRLDKDSPGGLEVNEEEAGVVQMIFNWYVEDGYSIYQIVQALEEREIKTQYGNDTWKGSMVAKLLKNTTYNKVKVKDKKQIPRDASEWIKIECTPIIPVEVFESAQIKLKENKLQLRKRPKRFFLLSGMIWCSECNHAYSASTNNTSQGYRHRMSHGHCSNRLISRGKIEPPVWSAVTEILFDPQSLRRGYKKMISEEKEREARNIRHLEALRTGIEKLLNKRQRLQTVYLDPDIGMSKDEYLGEKRLIDDQVKSAEEDIERIEKELSHVPSESDLVELEKMAGQITEALGENLDIAEAEKRKVLELLNIKVLISPDKKIKLTGFFCPTDSGVFSTISGHGMLLF